MKKAKKARGLILFGQFVDLAKKGIKYQFYISRIMVQLSGRFHQGLERRSKYNMYKQLKSLTDSPNLKMMRIMMKV